MSQIIPNFLVAGASKAGTEWLRLALREHPDIHMPTGGHTLDFFSRNYDKGIEWYIKQFADRNGETAAGEKSSSYIISPQAPKRIAEFNTDMKLIFVLRQPIDRAYSHYCMWLRGGLVSDDVNAELNEQSSLVTEGLYHEHIQQFFKHFKREQVKIVLYDDLRADATAFVADMYEFLGVDSTYRPDVLEQRYHATKSRPRVQWLYSGTIKVMRTIRRSSGIGNRLVESMRRRGYVNIFHKFNKGDEFPQLSDTSRAQLAQFYHDDIQALSLLIDRDLSHWLS